MPKHAFSKGNRIEFPRNKWRPNSGIVAGTIRNAYYVHVPTHMGQGTYSVPMYYVNGDDGRDYVIRDGHVWGWGEILPVYDQPAPA